jgi:DNA-binding IscR family transcriptional regulator
VTPRDALLQLLYERRGDVVGVDDVCDRIGRRVSRQAVSKAATILRRSVPVESMRGRRGGYRLGGEE